MMIVQNVREILSPDTLRGNLPTHTGEILLLLLLPKRDPEQTKGMNFPNGGMETEEEEEEGKIHSLETNTILDENIRVHFPPHFFTIHPGFPI